jgi:hypothetical protein
MHTKTKLFPISMLLALVAALALGCGAAAGQSSPETPCERDCALGFVSCLEDCFDDGPCRDECMAARSVCDLECAQTEPEPAAPDAGTPPS